MGVPTIGETGVGPSVIKRHWGLGELMARGLGGS